MAKTSTPDAGGSRQAKTPAGITGNTSSVSLVSPGEFQRFMQGRMHRQLVLARYLERQPLDRCELTRPLLGEMLAHCSQLVELLDSYGARNNTEWKYLRHLMAAGRLFAQVGYTLLHIKHSLGSYKLLPIRLDVRAATAGALRFNSNVMLCLASELVREARRLGMELPATVTELPDFSEKLPSGRLPHNSVAQKVGSPGKTVANLATAFLNLAAEAEVLHAGEGLSRSEYAKLIPDPICEESLRLLEQKFHNLQSLYDTYVSDTDTEQYDPDLPYLRGHVSLIFHLLESATHLSHYYERHLRVCHSENQQHPLVNPSLLIEQLVEYQLFYCSQFLKNAVSLCQSMLGRYARAGSVTVAVPKYRGFHVRPSTLVAKICLHYGSDVKMRMGEETYDASAPLDLFRANEYINAVKRRKLAEELGTMQIRAPKEGEDVTEAIRLIVYALAYQRKVVLYEHPLPIREFNAMETAGELFQQLVLNEIARLLAMGKLDIESALTVTFTGDERVLHDLKILAEMGYGEDDFGNNVPLPCELAYLRR